MSADFVDVVVPAPKGQEDKKYRMRFSNGLIDIQRERECTDARGKINEADLWVKRLTSDVEGLTSDMIAKMQRWELNALCAFWNVMNNVDEERFLEIYETVRKKSSIATTPSSDSGSPQAR